MTVSSSHSSIGVGRREFGTTNWGLVLAAQQSDPNLVQDALATLCKDYWYPLYAFIRRHIKEAHAAQDLTQEFFATILENDVLQRVDQRKGTFRAFLLSCCKNFLANQADRARAQKRGGGKLVFTVDFQDAENRYGTEPDHKVTAERLFERRWALTLLDQVLSRLQDDYARTSRLNLFALLKPFLMGDRPTTHYADVARTLGMSEGSIKVAVHRMRRRYKELLQEEIHRTVDTPDQIQEEIRLLFAALAT